ncbi:MAG: polyprenol monophosphomannose synthase [Nitrososphaerota archaeon]
MPRLTLAVIIPTYNEAGTIAETLHGIFSVFAEAELGGWVVVVDDGSPDGTGRIVGEMAADSYRVRLLERGRKMGIGSAYVDGFRYVLAELDAEAIATMDADGSHPPHLLTKMLGALERGADVVVGSRYVEGGRWGAELGRKIVSMGANLLARISTGYGVRDMTSGYRVYTRRAIESLNLDILKTGYVFQVAILYEMLKRGFRVAEIPFHFTPRRAGKSKLSLSEYSAFLGWSLKTLYSRLRM